MNDDNQVNAAAVWGMNKEKDHKGAHAVLLEGSWSINRTAVYSRYEFVQKSAEELALDEAVYGHDAIFNIHTLTLGANYRLFALGKLNMAAGGQWSIYKADSRLNTLYGKMPMALELYIRLYPSLMKMM